MSYIIRYLNAAQTNWYDIFRTSSPNTAIVSATIEQEANRAAVFTFSVAPGHPCYNDIVLFSTTIIVGQVIEGQPSQLFFVGRAVAEDYDIDGIKTFTCYDDFGMLDYSIQHPRTITGTPTQVVESLLSEYRTQTGQGFATGTISVAMASVTIDVDYGSTLQYINALADQYGGYFRANSYLPGHTLDWLAGSPRQSNQQIKLGSNVLSLAKSIQTDDFGTVLIPLGNNGLTISSVNAGKDYLESANTATYGKIWRTVTFNDINNATALKNAGLNYLAQIENPIMAIEISAVDLSLAFSDVDAIRLLDSVLVTSELHGINAWYDVTKLSTDLCDPSNNRITLNKNMRLPISRSVANLQNK